MYPAIGSRSALAWVSLAGVLLVALGVRWFFMSDALSYDEAQHYLVAKSPLFHDFVREFAGRGHPPLAYLLMKPFVALGPSVHWVRLAPLLCGLAAVVVVYLLLARILLSHGSALLGALLISLAPLFVKQSIEARHYSLCLLLVLGSLLLWQRMRARDFERASDHLLLAVLQLLALYSQYSAAFAVAALSLVVYAPLARRQAVRGDWSRIASWALPQIAVAAAAGLLFWWQFHGVVPSGGAERAGYPAAVYLTPTSDLGSLLDFGAVATFLWRQLGFFQNALLPAPFGLAVLLTLALAFAPWLRDDPRAGACRAVALYALVSLALTIAASLLGFFPFGGRPRHNAALVPGILIASYLSLALSVSPLDPKRGWPSNLRRLVAGSLIAVVAMGIWTGMRPGLAGRGGYERHLRRLGVERYRESPVNIIANWRGRIYAGWWFLPDAIPRRTGADSRAQIFDYSGVRVTEFDAPGGIAKRAVSEAVQSGETWVLLSHFRYEDGEHLRGVVDAVQQKVADTAGVELIFAGEARFFPPLVALQLRASKSSSPIGDSISD